MKRSYPVITSLPLRQFARASRLVGLAAALSFGAPAFANEASHAAYESALQSFYQHRLDHAFVHVKNALQADPQHLPSKVLIAEILLARGDGVGAANHLQLAREAGADEKQVAPLMIKAQLLQRQYDQALAVAVPEGLGQVVQSDIQVLYGAAHAGNNDLAAAAAAYARATELAPNNASALVGQAQMAVRLGQTEAALGYADRLLAVAPSDPRSFLVKAVVHQHAGNIEAGLVSANQAVMLGARNVSARITRALLLIDKGDTGAALADLDYILESRPLDPLATFMKYTILADEDRLQESEALLANLEISLERFPEEFKQDFPIYYYLSALTEFHHDKYSTARSSLLRYRALVGEDFKTLKLLGQIDLAQGDAAAAQESLLEAYRRNGRDVALLALLGEVHWQLGDLARSEDYYLKAIEQQPGVYRPVVDLAGLYLQAGRPDRSVVLLQSLPALETEPEALLLMVRACRAGGYVPQGLVFSEKLVALTPQDGAAHALRGSLLLNANQLEPAETSYRRALQLQANSQEVVVGLAQVLLRSGESQQALSLLKGQLSEGRQDANLLVAIGDVHLATPDRAKALFWYKKANAVDASNARPVQRLADLYAANDNMPAAIEVARNYLLLTPNDPQILSLAARLYRADEQFGEAVLKLKYWAGVSVDKSEPLLLLAQVQLQMGLAAEAKASLEQAIAGNEKLVPAHVELIGLASRDNDTAQALLLIERLRGVSPDKALANQLTGTVYRRVGQYDKAITYYQDSLTIAPSAEATHGLVEIYRQQRQNDKAIALLRERIDGNPRDLLSAITLAEMHRELRQLDQAAAMYARLLASYPENLVLLNNTAFVQLELGNLDEAVQLAERAHRGAPDSADIIDTRGWIETQRGNYDGALGLLRQASALDFDNAGIKYHLAYTLDKLERHDEARQVIAQISPAQMSGIIEQDVFHAGLSQQLVDGLQR